MCVLVSMGRLRERTGMGQCIVRDRLLFPTTLCDNNSTTHNLRERAGEWSKNTKH